MSNSEFILQLIILIVGTYFATATTTLVLCVFGINLVKKKDEVRHEIFVNDSMYGSFNFVQQKSDCSYSPNLVKVRHMHSHIVKIECSGLGHDCTNYARQTASLSQRTGLTSSSNARSILHPSL